VEQYLFQTLPEVSVWQAQHQSDAVAFSFEDHNLTFKDFDHHANQVAHGLIGIALSQSRVAILAKDSHFSYEVLMGCAKAKQVLTAINWRLAAQEILYILNDSAAEVLFVGEDFFAIVEQMLPELNSVKKIITLKGEHSSWDGYQHWRNAQLATAPDLSYATDDVVIQMYTSGTTGHPKGVLLAHYSFFKLMQGMAAQGDDWMSLNNKDVLLLSLPIFHIGGLWWAVQGFIAGANNIVVDSFLAWNVLNLIEKCSITRLIMVPAMIQFTLAEPSCKTTDFSSVKTVLYGGSPIAPALMRSAMMTFQCDFFQIYGMTETGNMAVCLRPEDHVSEGNTRMKSAGKALPTVEVRVIDGFGKILPANQTGEICLKSSSNMLGYWKQDKETAAVLNDGWMKTGDVGYIDDDGYVYVSDRIKDMIIYAGENIYPVEVEAALSEHEAVAEVAVIGIPDAKWGETVKAFVVVKPEKSIKKRELIKFVRGYIADFKVPKSVDFVESLPRNPSGKVLKRVLRAPYWEDKERQVS